MLTTNSEKIAQRLRVLRLHGMTRDAWNRYGETGYKHWDAVEAGWKYNMFDLQAALGISQLKKVDAWWERRRELVAKYDEAFRDLPGVGLLSVRPEVKSAYHIYVIQSLKKKRDDALNGIQARGVGLGVHFRPVHLMTFYKKRYGFKKGHCPIAERAGDRVLTLPLYPKMTDEEQARVIQAVKEEFAG
jgi:dTDP-4-amino-4,6-dideoxygalactose transaminase